MFIVCTSCDYQDWHSSDPARVFICPSEEKLLGTVQYAMNDWAVDFEEIEVWKLGQSPCKLVLKVEE
jgi:hypothetical protein